MRAVDERVRKKTTDRDNDSGNPPVCKNPRIPGQRDSKKWKHRQKTSLRRDREMTQCRLSKLALNHENQASSANLHSLVPAERKPKLMFPVKDFLGIPG